MDLYYIAFLKKDFLITADNNHSSPYTIFNESCLGLSELGSNSIDALVTDPPYGIAYQNHLWDKALPDPQIWEDCLRVMKPGAFGLVFSAARLMHRVMVSLEDTGFNIRDVLFWSFLNGMPKTRDIALGIDRELAVDSKVIGEYQYVQGYKKGGASHYKTREAKPVCEPASDVGKRYKGAGTGLKPAYEPVILIQKPIEGGLRIAQNVLKYGTGALNLEETRIPYGQDEEKVGHNPHPAGRVCANIVRTEPFEDGYDKFFLVPKVRQHKEGFNSHPTVKPVALMHHLVKLVSFKGQTILDPFAGSGSTGIAAMQHRRRFIGYEIDENYFSIMEKRLEQQVAVSACNQ